MLSTMIENSASWRILDYLIQKPELDFSKADVARKCKVSWKKADEILIKMEDLGVVKRSRTINRARMYQIVKDSKILENAVIFDLSVMKIPNNELATKQMTEEPSKYLENK